MKKRIITIIIIIAIIIAIVSAIIAFNNNNTNTNPSYDNGAARLSRNVNEEREVNRIASIVEHQNEIMQEANKETEISGFATKILDDTPARLNNIRITCGALNDTVVKAGDTFSFNEVVGKPTAARGYQEAKIIVDHEAELGIGGGNCQVSSTLYDAVLNVPSLVVVERHQHGNSVGYVPLGRDATISYGSLDLKFRNDLGKDIRIEASSDDKDVTIKLFQI